MDSNLSPAARPVLDIVVALNASRKGSGRPRKILAIPLEGRACNDKCLREGSFASTTARQHVKNSISGVLLSRQRFDSSAGFTSFARAKNRLRRYRFAETYVCVVDSSLAIHLLALMCTIELNRNVPVRKSLMQFHMSQNSLAKLYNSISKECTF